MIQKRIKPFLAVLLAIAMVLSLASCQKEVEDETSVPEDVVETQGFLNALPMPERPDQSAELLENGLTEKAQEKYEVNPDTIGWLEVPNTSISEQVMFYPNPQDKFYYLRRDFYKNYSWEGSYFVDYRSHFDGGRDGFSQNTVIYGHSMEDDANYPLFSQLKKFRNIDFAKENPYIYFSTLEENMAWEIFTVFVSTIDLPYNQPNPSPELPPIKDKATGAVKYEQDFKTIVDECRARSLYNYDVEVGEDDKILTLSTCVYNVNGVKLGYPNDYRFVIMARLVPEGEALRDMANLEANDDIKAP